MLIFIIIINIFTIPPNLPLKREACGKAKPCSPTATETIRDAYEYYTKHQWLNWKRYCIKVNVEKNRYSHLHFIEKIATFVV